MGAPQVGEQLIIHVHPCMFLFSSIKSIDLPCAKEKSAKSKSWKCSDIKTELEKNYGDDKTHRAQDGTYCPQDWT